MGTYPCLNVKVFRVSALIFILGWFGLTDCGITMTGKQRQAALAQPPEKFEGKGEMQTTVNPQKTPMDSRGKDQVNLIFDRAMQSLENGSVDQAMADLRQVITLAPELSVPHNNLGILYKRKGLLDQAIQEYKEAVRLKPDYAEAYNNLGIAYREKGLFREAEKAYREALRSKSDLAEAHYNLGVLYDLYLNRPEEAIQHYKDYLHWSGDEPKKQAVELWIAALQQKLQATQQK
jgi:tetratricopeptide (TPR) repeat protein